MKPASLSRIVVAIAVGLLGMISIANSPAWSQSLIGDGYSAAITAYSTYYRNGPTGKRLAAHATNVSAIVRGPARHDPTNTNGF